MPWEPYEKKLSELKTQLFSKSAGFTLKTCCLFQGWLCCCSSFLYGFSFSLSSKVWYQVNDNFPVDSNGMLYEHLIDLLALFLKQLHIHVIRYTWQFNHALRWPHLDSSRSKWFHVGNVRFQLFRSPLAWERTSPRYSNWTLTTCGFAGFVLLLSAEHSNPTWLLVMGHVD